MGQKEAIDVRNINRELKVLTIMKLSLDVPTVSRSRTYFYLHRLARDAGQLETS